MGGSKHQERFRGSNRHGDVIEGSSGNIHSKWESLGGERSFRRREMMVLDENSSLQDLDTDLKRE